MNVKDRDAAKNSVNPARIDLKVLAQDALQPIEKKLKGIYVPWIKRERQERPMSTSNLVQLLIQDASDINNLVCCSFVYSLEISNVP